MNKTTTPLFDWLDHRAAGALLHPTCLPGTQGIGVLDRSVTHWLDFLKDAGIHYWQVCPLGPTGYGDSPYQCFSAFAGNPYLIDLVVLQEYGLLDEADLVPLTQLPQDHVDFGALYRIKWPLLFKAFSSFHHHPCILPWGDFATFQEKHAAWLVPYCLFMAIKDSQQGRPWFDWPEDLRFYQRARHVCLSDDVSFRAQAYAFCQYVFFGQWQEVRKQATTRGIEIIGDAPIFVALDSADVWTQPELFQIDPRSGRPLYVAGVPPDYFSADGQLWGNPLYAWQAHAKNGFEWWLARLRANFDLCEVLRIDHFRAFDTYWAIPAEAENARIGEWLPGPGLAFFETLRNTLPTARLIAEDLGDLFPSVNELRHATGLPGMAILQFAFGGDACNSYLPHNLKTNSVVYPGTHDNDTSTGWYQTASDAARDHARRYLRVDGKDMAWDFIRAAYGSMCNLAIIPLQDLLMLDASARFNTPGVATGNWQWRYRLEQLETLHRDNASSLRALAEIYGRR